MLTAPHRGCKFNEVCNRIDLLMFFRNFIESVVDVGFYRNGILRRLVKIAPPNSPLFGSSREHACVVRSLDDFDSRGLHIELGLNESPKSYAQSPGVEIVEVPDYTRML